MPARQRMDVWTATAPKTPLQRGTFIDTCVNWLTMEPTTMFENENLVPTYTKSTMSEDAWDNTAFTLAEHNIQSTRICTFCEQRKTVTQALTANPFAQRHLVYVCSKCGINVN